MCEILRCEILYKLTSIIEIFNTLRTSMFAFLNSEKTLSKLGESIMCCCVLFVCPIKNPYLVQVVSRLELTETRKSLMLYHWIYSVIIFAIIIVSTTNIKRLWMKINYVLDSHQTQIQLLLLMDSTTKT